MSFSVLSYVYCIQFKTCYCKHKHYSYFMISPELVSNQPPIKQRDFTAKWEFVLVKNYAILPIVTDNRPLCQNNKKKSFVCHNSIRPAETNFWHLYFYVYQINDTAYNILYHIYLVLHRSVIGMVLT